MTTFLTILSAILLAGAGGWWLGAHGRQSAAAASPPSTSRKLLYYQSPMHPWVKSDKPGNCTVCGMALVPIYEGSEARSAASTDVVLLPEGSPAVANVQT